jgi:hypothetical protein
MHDLTFAQISPKFFHQWIKTVDKSRTLETALKTSLKSSLVDRLNRLIVLDRQSPRPLLPLSTFIRSARFTGSR